jgi:hypothetical protein
MARTHHTRTRLAVLQRLAPDLAKGLWRAHHVRELPLRARQEIADVLGHEAASRGLGVGDEANAYGRELGALVEALGLQS